MFIGLQGLVLALNKALGSTPNRKLGVIMGNNDHLVPVIPINLYLYLPLCSMPIFASTVHLQLQQLLLLLYTLVSIFWGTPSCRYFGQGTNTIQYGVCNSTFYIYSHISSYAGVFRFRLPANNNNKQPLYYT